MLIGTRKNIFFFKKGKKGERNIIHNFPHSCNCLQPEAHFSSVSDEWERERGGGGGREGGREGEREKVVLLSLFFPPCRCPLSTHKTNPLLSSACMQKTKIHFSSVCTLSFLFFSLILCLTRADITHTVPSEKEREGKRRSKRERERESVRERGEHRKIATWCALAYRGYI